MIKIALLRDNFKQRQKLNMNKEKKTEARSLCLGTVNVSPLCSHIFKDMYKGIFEYCLVIRQHFKIK